MLRYRILRDEYFSIVFESFVLMQRPERFSDYEKKL